MRTHPCSCINIKHKAPCREPVKFRCTKCGDHLCRACAKNHHAHAELEKVDVPGS